MATANRSHSALRWMTLVVVVAAIAFSNLTGPLGIGEDEAVVTARYETPFTPASYAFSIWGVIYASFVAFCVVQLLPSRRSVAAFDRMDAPLMATNLLGAGWVVAFRLEQIVLSNVIIFAMLGLGVLMMVRANQARRAGEVGFAFTIPFALFLGWISVASISNTSVALVSLGWYGGALGPSGWTVVMLAAAALIGVGVGVGLRQFLVPAVVAWAAFAIWVADRHTDDLAARAALGVAILTTIAAVALGVRLWREHGGHHRLSGARG